MPRVKIPVSPQHTSPVAAPVYEEPVVPVAQPIDQREVSSRGLLKSKYLITSIIALVFLILIVFLFSLMSDRNKLQSQVNKLSSSSSTSKPDEVNKLTREISIVFQLPSGETPTLATVSDVSKVRNQAFFKDAQNGDKVLLYSKAGEAILYRPSTKKIISVAPVNLNGNGANPTTNSSTSQP